MADIASTDRRLYCGSTAVGIRREVFPPARDRALRGEGPVLSLCSAGGRGREAQRERDADLVPHLVGGFPVALTDPEVEPPDARPAAHVADRDALLFGGAKREGHTHVARHAADGELADRFIAGGGPVELAGGEVRLGKFR